MRVAPKVLLNAQQRIELRAAAAAAKSVRRPGEQLPRRATIVLLAAEGKRDIDIAAELSIARQTAAHWRRRFLHRGVSGLRDDRPGARA